MNGVLFARQCEYRPCPMLGIYFFCKSCYSGLLTSKWLKFASTGRSHIRISKWLFTFGGSFYLGIWQFVVRCLGVRCDFSSNVLDARR